MSETKQRKVAKIYIRYAQISDWDNPQIVLRKVRIRALRGQSLDWLRVRPRTSNIVLVYDQSFACVRWSENGQGHSF